MRGCVCDDIWWYLGVCVYIYGFKYVYVSMCAWWYFMIFVLTVYTYIYTWWCGGCLDLIKIWSLQSMHAVSKQCCCFYTDTAAFTFPSLVRCDVQCIYGVQLIWNLWSLAQGTPKPLANPCRNATSIWYLEAPTLVFQLLEALQKRLIILSWPVCCCFKFVISCGLCDAFSTLWSTNIAMDSGPVCR